jgi:hypothetical protein
MRSPSANKSPGLYARAGLVATVEGFRGDGAKRRRERGETLKLSSFGSFVVRNKGQRIGRNLKTGTEVPISPRRVMVFKPSAILKQRINHAGSDGGGRE